ncbi:MAG: helix-turn-helix domain-containing GNAT family N-acetyltransferase [Candidatus Eisenbacteria bacterium]
MRGLGGLALASRLKRLSDRLYRGVARIYRELEIEVEPRWFPVLHLLSRRDSLSITEIAGALGLTHPAVHQTAAVLESKGLVTSRKGRGDERRRLLRLSAKGRRLTDRLAPVWRVVRERGEDLAREAGVDLLGTLDRIEGLLDKREMYDRIVEGLPELRVVNPEIVEYRPAYKKWFERLNREWLEEYFSVEPGDERLLRDPNGRILRRGGGILFAKVNGEVVGTAALIPVDGETVELAKMAVTAGARGRGIGRALALAALTRAERMGASAVILHTSPDLRAAGALYRSLGFRRDRSKRWGPIPYARCTIRMVLELEGGRRPSEGGGMP